MRSKRIIWDHIYIIATGHDGFEADELLVRFDKLPFKNKVVFTRNSHPEYRWVKQIKFAEKMKALPPFTVLSDLTGRRMYETAFDLAEWIRKCEESDL